VLPQPYQPCDRHPQRHTDRVWLRRGNRSEVCHQDVLRLYGVYHEPVLSYLSQLAFVIVLTIQPGQLAHSPVQPRVADCLCQHLVPHCALAWCRFSTPWWHSPWQDPSPNISLKTMPVMLSRQCLSCCLQCPTVTVTPQANMDCYDKASPKVRFNFTVTSSDTSVSPFTLQAIPAAKCTILGEYRGSTSLLCWPF
jgi:hypothetical protein